MSLTNFDILAQNLLINFLKNISLETINREHQKLNDDYDYLVVDHHHHHHQHHHHQQHYHHYQQGLLQKSLLYRKSFRPQNYRHHTFLLHHTIPTASSFLSQPLTNSRNSSTSVSASSSSSLSSTTPTTTTTFGSDYYDSGENSISFPDFIDPNHENNDNNIFFPSTDQNNNLEDLVAGAEDSTIVEKLYLGHFIIAIILALIILTTVIGNLLVIAAILCERHLQTVGNYLVFSLAVADLLVACLVMPFGAIYVVTGKWTLGAYLCDLWTVADVLCCTASILHLLAIALDRFWAVTNVDYIHQRRNGRRIGLMILLIWLVSLIISVAPILGWRDSDFHERIKHKQCLISQDVTYQIFATCSSFYLPLLLILILYWRIFQVARKRIRHKPGNKVSLVAMKNVANNKAVSSSGVDATGKIVSNVDNNNDNNNGGGFKCQNIEGFGSRFGNFRKKLLKYSREEYLRPDQPERPVSDIVSHNVTDLQVDDSINSFDEDDSCEFCAKLPPGEQCSVINGEHKHHHHHHHLTSATTTANDPNVPSKTVVDGDRSSDHSSPSPSSSSLVPSNNKKLSIISTNRTTTTTTYMTTISYESTNDNSNTENQNSNAANQNSYGNNNKKDHRSMIINNPECSIIAEESSSSNSATQPLLNVKCDHQQQQNMDIDENDVMEHNHRNSSSSTGKNSELTTTTLKWKSVPNHCDNDHSRINVIYHHYDDDDDDHNQINNKRIAVAMVDGGNSNNNNNDDGGGDERKRDGNGKNPINHNCANIDCTVTNGDVARKRKSCTNSDDNNIKRINESANSSAVSASCTTLTNNGNFGTSVRIRFDAHQDDDDDHNDSTKYSFDNDTPPSPPPTNSHGSLTKCQQKYFTNDCINKNIINIDNSSDMAILDDNDDLDAEDDDNVPVININNNNNVTSGQPTPAAMANNHHHHHHHHHSYIKTVGDVQSVQPSQQQQQYLQIKPAENRLQQQKESVESKRERKAAKTLAIITGVFVCCWLPFFINALLSPLWKTYQELVPSFLTDFFLWLGYVNSCVNPIIYTIFSPDFRTAFKRMLLGKKRVRSSNKAAWSAKAARV